MVDDGASTTETEIGEVEDSTAVAMIAVVVVVQVVEDDDGEIIVVDVDAIVVRVSAVIDAVSMSWVSTFAPCGVTPEGGWSCAVLGNVLGWVASITSGAEAIDVVVSCLHLTELVPSSLPAILVFPSPSTLSRAIVVAVISLVSGWFILHPLNLSTARLDVFTLTELLAGQGRGGLIVCA
jgi:hypothetical protein